MQGHKGRAPAHCCREQHTHPAASCRGTKDVRQPSTAGSVSKLATSSMKGGEGYSRSIGPASAASSGAELKPFIRSRGEGGRASKDRAGTTSPHVRRSIGSNAATAPASGGPTSFGPVTSRASMSSSVHGEVGGKG